MLVRSCFLLALSFGWCHGLMADVLYSVIDLGALFGNPNLVSPRAINDSGQVTGTWSGGAFLYSNGQVIDLGSLGGGQTFASDINNTGQVTGFSFTSTRDVHAFVYRDGQMNDLGTVAGSYLSLGRAINDLGQVVGDSQSSSYSFFHAFLYSNGQMTDLGTLGGEGALAKGINNAGQVVGGSAPASAPLGPLHAFLYNNGQMNDLGTLGGDVSVAYGINNAGQVVGSSYISTACCGSDAFLYSNGQMNDLGNGYAYAINDAGQVVGSFDGGNDPFSHAFLYSNGQRLDLNDLIDPSLGIKLLDATAINNRGQIVADRYLLTPIPEPSTLALFGVACAGLLVRSRRRPSILR